MTRLQSHLISRRLKATGCLYLEGKTKRFGYDFVHVLVSERLGQRGVAWGELSQNIVARDAFLDNNCSLWHRGTRFIRLADAAFIFGDMGTADLKKNTEFCQICPLSKDGGGPTPTRLSLSKILTKKNTHRCQKI